MANTFVNGNLNPHNENNPTMTAVIAVQYTGPAMQLRITAEIGHSPAVGAFAQIPGGVSLQERVISIPESYTVREVSPSAFSWNLAGYPGWSEQDWGDGMIEFNFYDAATGAKLVDGVDVQDAFSWNSLGGPILTVSAIIIDGIAIAL